MFKGGKHTYKNISFVKLFISEIHFEHFALNENSKN